MPQGLGKQERVESTAPPKSNFTGTTFGQRREDIYKRLCKCSEQCRLNYSGRKELATEKDEVVAELCESLEDAFTYGLRQPQSFASVTAASLFQNMHEIVIGNVGNSSTSNGFSNNTDSTFWDFCQIYLTPHERQRYEELKHIWTKSGFGKAFIRATLNENSLQRYLLTWLSSVEDLQRYYTSWSLLLDVEVSKQLPNIIGNLNGILFALTVDKTELNASSRLTPAPTLKAEPIIYAPTPLPVAATSKQKRKTNIVERPIATANSTEDLLQSLHIAKEQKNVFNYVEGEVESITNVKEVDIAPPDPIAPELEFLKQPLPDFYPENHTLLDASNDQINSNSTSASSNEHDYEDKSDSSSQYSKSSSANCSGNHAALEEKLREMTERCELLETRVAKLSLENRLLVRRLTQHFNESGIDPSSSLTTNFLITIPQVKLLKSNRGSSYYVYEVHITMRQHLEHWFVLRRYREFYKLHKSLLRSHPSIAAVEFPPKKHFGNMNLAFVEERRQQLQIYLLNIVESLPQVEACKTKGELQKVFPFLRER